MEVECSIGTLHVGIHSTNTFQPKNGGGYIFSTQLGGVHSSGTFQSHIEGGCTVSCTKHSYEFGNLHRHVSL